MGVVATPDIHNFEVIDIEYFIILGCDGLWGVFGSSEAIDFVQKFLNANSLLHLFLSCNLNKEVPKLLQKALGVGEQRRKGVDRILLER
ncbi:hypothetical protein JHK82_019027 [Glycine max]|nr:hypothetical protein JHK82_019027 [Glycine max]